MTAALVVVFANRVIYSALALIVCFGAIAGLFFQLDAQFIAAVQVIVYAGAIMVLFLFVIMLLDPESEDFSTDRLKQIPILVVPLAAALAFILIQVTFLWSENASRSLSAGGHTAGSLQMTGNTESLARLLFREYLLPFEITSILILSAVLGAVILTRRPE
ncbi:MAG: NADH-quinone oxidoreductase subunit J [Acidobacteriota bacterium]